MNHVLILGALALVYLTVQRLTPDGLSAEEKRLIARRFAVKPLWQREGLPQFDMERVIAHYSAGNSLEDVAGIAYANERFARVRAMARLLADAAGFDVDEEAVIAVVLSLQGRWELYWVNKLLPSHGVTDELGAIMERSLSDEEWVPVMRHLVTLPDFGTPG
jgi:GNAT superfamily N-acetyltransferase